MSDMQVHLPIGWHHRLLADLGEWSGGQTPLKSNPLYWQEGNVLWVSPKDIIGPLIVDSEDKITSLGLTNTRLHLYPVTSIMIVVRSGILRHRFPVTRCTKPFTVNQDLKVLIPHDDVDSQFIFCMLNQLGPTILSRVVKAGTTVESVDIPVFLSLSIPTPPPPEQRKIARILTTVDNLIEKTEALIAKYQAIKQGMMHDLFTRGVDEHGHLRPPYEEAPELYKQSELGWIPKEWDFGTLGSVCRWMSGGTPSKSNPAFWSGSVPWFSPKDMKSFELIDSEDHISEEASQCGTRLIDTGTVLIVIRGMILAHSFPVGITTRTATFNQDVKALTCDGPVIGRFLAYWLTAHAQEMVNLATESTHGTKRFDMDDLYSVALGVPNKDEQSRTVELLDTLGNNHKAEQARLGNLLQIKTGLMQDLLTGKVRVKVDEAEEVAAHA